MSPRRTRAAAGTALLILLSGCGLADVLDQPTDPFLDQGTRAMAQSAFKDMRSLESVRMTGSMPTELGRLTRFDVLAGSTACVGSLTGPEGGFRLVVNKRGGWIKPDDRFWRSQSGSPEQADLVVDRLHGKWLAIPPGDDTLKICDLKAIFKGFRLTKKDTDATIRQGELVSFDGTETVELRGRDKKNGRSSIWVTLEEPHHVLKMESTSGKNKGSVIRFEDFDVEVVARGPRPQDVFDPAIGT